jgi:TonB family protein
MKLESTYPLGSFPLRREAVGLPEYVRESSARSPQARKALNWTVSVLFHVLLLGVVAALSLVAEPPQLEQPEQKMDMVLVRLPSPEPPGSQSGGGPGETKQEEVQRPKALARRAFAANVSQFKSVVQQAVTQVAPNPVFADVTKVQVEPLQRTQAPKAISQRVVNAATVDALQVADAPKAANVVAAETPTLRQAPTVTQSAGPKIVAAAGPIVSKNESLGYEQPTVADGVADSVTVAGDATGPRIRALQTGSGTLYGSGHGRGSGRGSGSGNGSGDGSGNGSGSGVGDGSGSGGGIRDCNKDPECMRYLELIKDRVYKRWNPDRDVPIGKVQLRFRIDRSGSANDLELIRSANQPLGESALVAFRHASPFPPPPASIAYIFGKNLTATFDFTEVGH